MKKDKKLQKSTKTEKPAKKLEKLDLPDELELILESPSISESTKKEIIRAVSIATRESFSGPIPPPKLLNDYNNVINNGAERLMKMAENQSNHRIKLEDYVIKEEIKQSQRGQWFGFVLAIIGLGTATWLALEGHDTIAGIFGTTTIVGLVTVFVLGNRKLTSNSDD